LTEKAFNLASNKIGGDWEFSALADLLTELNTGAFDMELTGFDEDELSSLMGWTPDFEPVDESEQPRLDEKKKVTCPECGCCFEPKD
jgi:hypothetical protein